MARAHRIAYKGAHYHVYNRAASRKTCCFTRSNFSYFQYLLHEIVKRYGVEIYAYCMMKNHYHIYLSTPQGNISEAMWYFGMHFSMKINKEINGDGPLFRGRFKTVLIESERHALTLCRYIHLNPVKANLTTDPEHYLWSSYTHYLYQDKSPEFLNTQFILSHFLAQDELKEFTNLGVDSELADFYSKQRIQPILGSDKFKRSFR